MIRKGMRVKSIVSVGLASAGEEGVVKKIENNHVCVEFDRFISGHDGGPDVMAKNGHCWWLGIKALKPLEASNNLEAVSLLKEEF